MKNATAEISPNGHVAYLPGVKAIVTLDEVPTAGKEKQPYLEPENKSSDYAHWGDNNDRPQVIMKKVEKNVVASSGLEWICNAFFGEGLITYKRSFDDNNKEVITPTIFPEWEDFARRNDINGYLEESLYDFIWFRNIFPEMFLGRDRYKTKIVKISHKEAAFSRWGVMNPKTRKIEKFYYAADWPNPRNEYMATVPVWDKDNPFKYNKFIQRVKFASIGRTYYAKPTWHSVIDSGWLDISNSIPQVKKSLLKNSMAIKYHIQIPAQYWSDKYKGYDKMTADKQKEVRQVELNQLNDFLTGQDNVGKAFVSHYGLDKQSKKELPGWKIDKIPGSIEDGVQVMNDTHANAMILFALNLDPTLKGAGLANTKMSSGSGSDKREAKSIFVSQLGLSRKRFLAPLYFIKLINGWDSEMEFGFKDSVLTTLDVNPTGTQKVMTQ